MWGSVAFQSEIMATNESLVRGINHWTTGRLDARVSGTGVGVQLQL